MSEPALSLSFQCMSVLTVERRFVPHFRRWTLLKELESLDRIKVELRSLANPELLPFTELEMRGVHIHLEMDVHSFQSEEQQQQQLQEGSGASTREMRAGKMLLAPTVGGTCHIHFRGVDF